MQIECVYNISYSPEFNPIEMTFSQLKHHWRKAKGNLVARGEPFNSEQLIEDAIGNVGMEMVIKQIDHSRALLKECGGQEKRADHPKPP